MKCDVCFRKTKEYYERPMSETLRIFCRECCQNFTTITDEKFEAEKKISEVVSESMAQRMKRVYGL